MKSNIGTPNIKGRNLLAVVLVSFTLTAITALTIALYFTSNSDENVLDKIFNALLPMFGTWVGTVLAFYFGRENFEAASNRYEEIIKNLSPDVLDDIAVSQIMITKKTMVTLTLEDVRQRGVKDILKFLNDVKKTRLPILENEEIKYIVHRSTFQDALITCEKDDLSFECIEEDYKNLITSFIIFRDNTILEEVSNELKKQNNLVKDIFIVNSKNKVMGWITDSLIFRYLNTEL